MTVEVDVAGRVALGGAGARERPTSSAFEARVLVILRSPVKKAGFRPMSDAKSMVEAKTSVDDD